MVIGLELRILNGECSSTVDVVLPGTLHWRHNDHDGVSNHQPHGCLLNRLFRRRSHKTSKLRVTGLCVGNSPGPVNSPHKRPVTRKMFPFDDVIMYYSGMIYIVSLMTPTEHLDTFIPRGNAISICTIIMLWCFKSEAATAMVGRQYDGLVPCGTKVVLVNLRTVWSRHHLVRP